MNHRQWVWLQQELSNAFSQMIGEEVNPSVEETLYIVSVLNQSLHTRSNDHRHTTGEADQQKAGAICPQESAIPS